jgi:hypothetical protein
MNYLSLNVEILVESVMNLLNLATKYTLQHRNEDIKWISNTCGTLLSRLLLRPSGLHAVLLPLLTSPTGRVLSYLIPQHFVMFRSNEPIFFIHIHSHSLSLSSFIICSRCC